ncbi:MAG: tape measure protein [Martelella sp.]|uniref:tape measure protein n=1 Tax=Martelella sp. TaxID=1969699 RepID=UPI00324270C2
MAGTVIEELVALLGWDLTGEEDLKRFKKGLRDAERGLESFARQASLFAAAAATAFAGAMTVFGKSVISTSANFEQMTATLETIEGSSEKAKQSMDWVAEFAKTTPYELNEVAQSFVRLRAYGLDPMNGSLAAVGDAASAMGKSIMSGVEALADAVTGENERLKEFGITTSVAGDQITYMWNQNGVSMSKTLKKNGQEIAKFLQENFEIRFGGAMIRQSKTWDGMFSNMLDTWTLFQKRVGDKGFFDTVKFYLGDFLDYISALDADGTLDRWATNISKSMETALRFGIGQVLATIEDIKWAWQWFKDNPDVAKPLVAALGAIAAITFKKTAAILVLQDFIRSLQGRESLIGDLAAQLNELTNIDVDTLERLFQVLEAAVIGLFLFPGTMKGVAKAIRSLANAIGMFAVGSTAASGAGVLTGLLGALGVAAIPTNKANLSDIVPRDDEERAILDDARKRISEIPDWKVWDDGRDISDEAWNKIQARRERSGYKPEYNVPKSARPDGFDARRFDNGPVSGNDDLLQKLQNFAANMNKASGDGAAANVNNTMNDNRVTNQTFNNTVNQTVTQATQAPEAAARATNDAVSRNLKGLDPARMNGGGGF